MKDYSHGEYIWRTSTANWNYVIQYNFKFTIEDERREISATLWVHSYKRFSAAFRWSPDKLQVNAEKKLDRRNFSVCLLIPDNQSWF
jgi:hypothetical protein